MLALWLLEVMETQFIIILLKYHIFAGSKTEMDRLEDQFVTGEWVPPGMTPAAVAPTTKKTKKRRGNVRT